MAQVTISPGFRDKVLAYCRLEDLADDPGTVDLIDSLVRSAISYLGLPYDEQDDLYTLAIKGLVAHWYDNRDAISPSSMTETPLGLRQIINQLKLRPIPPVPDSGTEGLGPVEVI